jgi:hypothetical protein
VDARDAGRVRAWLSDSADPLALAWLRARPRSEGDDALGVEVAAWGTRVVREPRGAGPPRRVLELDRDATVLTTLRWDEDGRLGHAWIRITEDSWVMIEPRAAYQPPWGLCDRLWHAAHPSAGAQAPLTLVESVDYGAVDRIPVVLEPARLPSGAGAAVLNLVAALSADAGRARVDYRGPYPTEQLFLTLLESFRYRTTEADPVAAFMGGRLEWTPAPHERASPGPGVTVHFRERVEKVTWRGRAYHRPDWQGIQRHAPRRVRDVDGGVVCSLWALGEPIEDHLRLDAKGAGVESVAPPPLTQPAHRLPDAVRDGVASVAAALGAAPLARRVREIASGCELVWSSLDGDVISVEVGRLSVSHVLREALRRRLYAASTRAERLALGLAALAEIAHLIADPLRARAQSDLATLSPETQARLLASSGTTDAEDARRVTGAIECLIADVASGP